MKIIHIYGMTTWGARSWSDMARSTDRFLPRCLSHSQRLRNPSESCAPGTDAASLLLVHSSYASPSISPNPPIPAGQLSPEDPPLSWLHGALEAAHMIPAFCRAEEFGSRVNPARCAGSFEITTYLVLFS